MQRDGYLEPSFFSLNAQGQDDWKGKNMAGQGSGGNVLAALCSFFIPGLGQLLQGRLLIALFQFVLAAILWFIWMGWLIHLWSVLNAARWRPGD